MIHSPSCTIAESTRLTLGCPRCEALKVGDLDDRHFAALMGCTRREFERWCQLPQPPGIPSGLDAFWDVIMEANALQVQLRADELRGRRQ